MPTSSVSGPSPAFLKLVHGIYRRSSAVYHFFSHRIRPLGLLMLVVAPVSWLLIPSGGLGPMFMMRSILIALLGVGLVGVFFRRRGKLHVKRIIPRLASVGETVRYQLEVTNQGKQTLAGGSLLEMLPDNRPSLLAFVHAREPLEDTRNIFDRTLVYHRWEWLQRKLTLFTDAEPIELGELKAGADCRVTSTLTPTKRGIIPLRDMRLCLPDALGLFQRCRKLSSQHDKLVVLPRRYRLPPLQLDGSARFQIGGETSSSTVGQVGDFTGVREYRPGDPLRHIHWKSWARTAKPIVKEYEDVYFPRYGLVLDTFADASQGELFEEAVSVAASYAASIDTQESLLDLMFIRDEAYVFSAGRGEERVDRMLEVLAGVQCDPVPDFEALQKLVLRHHGDLTACICVFASWSEQRRDTVQKLHRSGVNLRVISVCESEEAARSLLADYPSPIPVQVLLAGQVQQDLMKNFTN